MKQETGSNPKPDRELSIRLRTDGDSFLLSPSQANPSSLPIHILSHRSAMAPKGQVAIKGAKAAMLYDTLDNSKLFTCPAQIGSRSDMNVAFRSASEELDAKFVKEATAAGLTTIKGHRNVGGMRASIYNAMPQEGIEKLCDFIKAFDKNN